VYKFDEKQKQLPYWLGVKALVTLLSPDALGETFSIFNQPWKSHHKFPLLPEEPLLFTFHILISARDFC
jgi:hypothetical protein